MYHEGGGGGFRPQESRRGSTIELLNAGATLATILTAATWAASGYRGYLDLHRAIAVVISRFLVGGLGSDSDDEGPAAPHAPRNERRVRKRMRDIPPAFDGPKTFEWPLRGDPLLGLRWDNPAHGCAWLDSLR